MPRAKRLTPDELTRQNEALDQRRKVLLLGKYEEYIDMRFRKRKIQRLMQAFLLLLADPQWTNSSDRETTSESFYLLYALIVKHFTSIELPPIDNLEQLISVSNALYDTGVLNELFGNGEQAFDRQELLKLSAELVAGMQALVETIGNQSADVPHQGGQAE
ncbi:hypothetical protein [Paenibacillus cymbidii]|uniref:hypothetical protein n=1 Tax=Paenibacillus cymbidii TaxID=1639034 RepID=UPI0010807EA3|nr:hypothetical protein [Paenibacillus cymbidii]